MSIALESDRRSYRMVAEAIRFVRAHAREQPSLEDVAKHMGLSPPHLQRVFSEWAGISPKRFLQFLTKEYARKLLRASRDVLAASIESGLSGPGRLHDLMLSCEAMTPGEVGSLGEGLTIRFGFASSPLGHIIAGTTPRGVCHLRFVEPGAQVHAERELRADWPKAVLERDDDCARGLARDVFGRMAVSRPLSVLLRGTNFQIKVWESLMRVPAGLTLSYSDLGRLAGCGKAPRAVGTAVARNPIAVLVPCHRVIRENGDIGEYRWGPERKAALLARELASSRRRCE